MGSLSETYGSIVLRYHPPSQCPCLGRSRRPRLPDRSATSGRHTIASCRTDRASARWSDDISAGWCNSYQSIYLEGGVSDRDVYEWYGEQLTFTKVHALPVRARECCLRRLDHLSYKIMSFSAPLRSSASTKGYARHASARPSHPRYQPNRQRTSPE